MTYKITKNGRAIKSGLSKEKALNNLFVVVEDFSNGYIYDNDSGTIYHETDGSVVANQGDDYVQAGDDLFEIEEEI